MLAAAKQLLVQAACGPASEGAFPAAAAASAALARAWSGRSASTSAPAPPPERVHIPEHEVEQGLPVLTARVRESVGTLASVRLRKQGLTPGQLFSLPGNRTLALSFDSKDAAAHVRRYGRNGIKARVLQLNLVGPQEELLASVRVLPKEVYMNSVTLNLENMSLMFVPRQRQVSVDVPVTMWGDDMAPGVKRGGWLHMVNRTVPIKAQGWAIPPQIELDVRHMQTSDVLRFRDVPLPEGCTLRAKDPMHPVVRCALRVGGD